MDSFLEDQATVARSGDLSASLGSLENTIRTLESARCSIVQSPANASIVLAKLQNPIKHSFDGVNTGLKGVHKALGDYSKILDKRFKDKTLSRTEHQSLSAQSGLFNRAIGMHFLREGQFAVASAFMKDTMAPELDDIYAAPLQPPRYGATADRAQSDILRKQFGEMYHILDEMKNNRNLVPAVRWARAHSAALEARGSNLEFDLCKLQFISLFFLADAGADGEAVSRPQRLALHYAQDEFGSFQDRYLRDIQQLIGAMAFCPNLRRSPYARIFYDDGAWEDLAASFTREFCSLLGLSADSPMFIAATAGAIALPTLQKLRGIMEKKRTEWTTQNELPVEIPLPPSYRFHSVFVCPVSKEQTTDQNPPMMMPCGHVVAQDSLQRLSKVSRFKCPYCPSESHYKDAKKVFL